MSTRESRVPSLRYARNTRRRKMVLDVDLNAMPPIEGEDQEGTSAGAAIQVAQASQQGGVVPSTLIDLEALDDDVVISSPRAFAEAKKNSRGNHGRTVVVDVDSEERSSRFAPNNRCKRRKGSANQAYINLEGSSNSMGVSPPPTQPPPPPKEPTFSCPVCMGPLVEEMSTKCGHIFCKACIKAAIAAQNKCPACRRKVTMKDIIRVYLPATN